MNKGASGIAVFGEQRGGRQRVRYYFDLSDTHEGYRSRPVPLWTMRPEDEPAVIETLENSFGELEKKETVGEAVLSVAANLTEDNLKEYLNHLERIGKKGRIGRETPDKQEKIIRKLTVNSVACMIMTRLGVDISAYPEVNRFEEIIYFDHHDVLTLIGSAGSDIARMALSEVSKTVRSVRKENRIVADEGRSLYDMLIKDRGGENHGTDLPEGREGNASQRDDAEAGEDESGPLRPDEGDLPEGERPSFVLPPSDQLSPLQSSEGDRGAGDGDGRTSGQPDGEGRGRDGGIEARGSDGVERPDEQHPEPVAGDRDARVNHELRFYDQKAEDRRLPFFGRDDTIRDLFLSSDKLLASKQEIEAVYQTKPGESAWTDYIRSIFNLEQTTVHLSDGTEAGYQAYSNGVLMWEGIPEEKTKQTFYRWNAVSGYFRAMHLLGELTEENPFADRDGQFALEGIGIAEKKAGSIFTQEIIDIVLRKGSSFEHGKFRIIEHFSQEKTAEEDVKLLKKEYGIGGSSDAVWGTGIWENHDGKGLELSKGLGDGSPKILLSWKKVAKRIHELIRDGDYLYPEQMEKYREWKADREEQTAALWTENKPQKAEEAPKEQGENQPEKQEKRRVYRYKDGDHVYLGTDLYEIIWNRGGNVLLQDARYPLFQKELAQEEFLQKLKENSLNHHLLVEEEVQAQADPEMEEAKRLIIQYAIDSFCTEEDKAKPMEELAAFLPDFSDLSHVGIASTMTEDEQHTIEVAVNFEKNAIQWYVDQELIDSVMYTSLRNLIDNELKFLDFNGLVGCVDMEEVNQLQADFEAAVLSEHRYEDVEEENGENPDVPNSEENIPEAEIIPSPARIDFNLAAHPLEYVTPKECCRQNIEAIRVLKQCEAENRPATAAEQVVLSRYVGWGGLSEAFDSQKWPEEYGKLQMVMTPEEFKSASASTLTAFFTPADVIAAVYKAIGNMGFTEGNILEPSCGIGNFFGMLPDTMQGSRLYGVELDSISARIAGQLYQTATVMESGFEKADLPDSFFDVVVGNVPFGDFGVVDKKYEKNHFLIHDYFFAKSLDKLRPGGVMALITSKGTMDKQAENVRRYIADRAELLGAVRLPTSTFLGNANTKVTSDILFLQKREKVIQADQDWIHLDTDENGVEMNRYYVKHPEMMLGRMELVSTRYGYDSACIQQPNTDLEELLMEAAGRITGTITAYEPEEPEEKDRSIPADPAVRNFSYTLVDGNVYFRENSRMYPEEVSVTAKNRIKGMIGIRDALRELIELQVDGMPDTAVEDAQKLLHLKYDVFTKEYGLINSRANSSVFSADSSYSLICALEILDENGELKQKADIFYKRTIKSYEPVTRVDTAGESLAVSMGEHGFVDMDFMCSLCEKSEEEIVSELDGIIFLNPEYALGQTEVRKYLTADEYLSGNVRRKLKQAEYLSEKEPETFASHVKALQAVQPEDLTAAEISVRLGSVWIPPEVVEKFMYELLQTPYYIRRRIKINFVSYTKEWKVTDKNADGYNIRAVSTYGTERINAYKIIEETLNLKDVRIVDYFEDADGKKKAVLNKKETALAQAKQEQIKQAFKDWIWKDAERRNFLCAIYNERFNSVRVREYDGSHLVFPGMNPEISLRSHQLNAIAHMIYGGNTLLAHAVGAGKTYEMVAAAVECKRLGFCVKPMFVVPNHLTRQIAAEFLQLYPGKNVLVAARRDFETKNRKKFCSRIATGEYDAIIIGHSQFEKIPMSRERQIHMLEQELEEITNGIEAERWNRGERGTVKQLEREKKAVMNRLEKLNEQSRKDDVVTFEELGVDMIFVDEAHYFKNLYIFTKMRNVAGISQTEAQKSSDLYMKCRYLDEINHGRGVVFATGTPISNSMVEMFTMQRYLQHSALKEAGLETFDAWASTFGETVMAVELTPEGTGYRAKTRFARFFNLPELMTMFREAADIQTAEMLNLPVPEAEFINVAVKPSEMQKEMVASLADRAEKIRNGMVNSQTDNMLKVTNDGRKLALDQRMINPLLPDFEGSKVNACVKNIFRIWAETKEKRLAQLVFCDLSTPRSDGSFSVYNDIRDKLIANGVPAEEVKFIHEADTESKKAELFKKVRSGEVRILMGSTQKMGAGTNVQNRLIALHDLDCPWRPADLEQRMGRIVRQGNENEKVQIYRYVTEQTFDAYLYQLVEGKQKFAAQIMSGKTPVRAAEDIDETALSFAEIKMLATGDSNIKEKMDLDIQVQRLQMLKASFLSEKYALEDQLLKTFPLKIAKHRELLKGYEHDIKTASGHPAKTDDAGFLMVVEGDCYTGREEAGKAVLKARDKLVKPDAVPLGEYRGFTMEIKFEPMAKTFCVIIKGNVRHTAVLGEDARGAVTRIDHVIDGMKEKRDYVSEELDSLIRQADHAKEEIKKPFIHEEELKQKQKRLNELNVLLNVDKRENELVDGDVEAKEETRERTSREKEER